jgi:subtilisin family serine protease
MFIKRMFFILAAVIAAAPMFAVVPIVNANARDKIEGQYIVVIKDGRSPKNLRDQIVSVKLPPQDRATILFDYGKALVGFAAILPDRALKIVLASDDVQSVEANIRAASAATIQRQPPPLTPSVPRGLDRTDHRLLPLKGRSQFIETGKDVHVYVIDTGIRSTHEEFSGRVSTGNNNGYSVIDDTFGTEDCNGHGTHVAGTIGGNNYGVAKKVTLHPVRVLDCNGFGDLAGILAGVNWVIEHKKSPAVANMSLRLTRQSPVLKSAIQTSIDANITYVVAAGNLLGRNACSYSPADVTDAITVGSVNPENDRRSVLSAIGPCIDLFAPGVRILSATVSGSSNSASEELSGTSMAAAHVSGVAALVLQGHPTFTPSKVWAAIHHSDDVAATPGWHGIDNRYPCSPNEMLHWGPRDDGFNDGDSSPVREKTNAPNP